MIPLKNLNNFWETLEMSLINCGLNLILIWSENCVILSNPAASQATIFPITDRDICVPDVTLLTQDYTRLLQKLKSEFKPVNVWYKYQSKVTTQTQNQYLGFLTDSSFQEVYRLFVLYFEHNAHRTINKRYFLPIVELNHVKISRRSIFDQTVKNYERTNYNNREITDFQGDDYTTVCLLD